MTIIKQNVKNNVTQIAKNVMDQIIIIVYHVNKIKINQSSKDTVNVKMVTISKKVLILAYNVIFLVKHVLDLNQINV